jgi:hypothetical protein
VSDLYRRTVCRLRGHLNATQTLRMDDEARDVRLYCRRCGVTLAQRTDPVLLSLRFAGQCWPLRWRHVRRDVLPDVRAVALRILRGLHGGGPARAG